MVQSKLQNMVKSLKFMTIYEIILKRTLTFIFGVIKRSCRTGVIIIKEECKTADLKEWEFANVRSYVIKELLAMSKD